MAAKKGTKRKGVGRVKRLPFALPAVIMPAWQNFSKGCLDDLNYGEVVDNAKEP